MIDKFKGLYSFLSNFYMVDITLKGIVYPSVEHAYMAHKSDDPRWQVRCQDKTVLPGTIKKESYSVKLRDDWDTIKLDVMKECLHAKFKREPLRSMLLDTGLRELIEGNTWGDKYWGMDLDTRVGQNHLGRLLMEVRAEIAAEPIASHRRTY